MDKVKKSNLDLKKEKVIEIAKKVGKAKTIVFANYHGLSASQISELREKIKAAGGELIVAKNTLISRALIKNQLPVTSDQLAGPTATLLAYEDEIAPIKKAAETATTPDFSARTFWIWMRLKTWPRFCQKKFCRPKLSVRSIHLCMELLRSYLQISEI
ncbi:MAG: 50S ribosomal protein L10 [Candidatus Curtissbacteria bacterium GW2011_GWA1_40_16]|uniref:Large ribosomal subunit protein uL10 n=1 Tax=Candidatus Curtissbacteria bacterium GW2011_GWA1_40_16 TaxID=1618405 RepID=A0A0G0RDI3_9BACT|nr:MAG: 50S ribosomal protein L10 [Candidatus Curtissbacteria bacterium GW2011_GWA1_40_16]